MLSNIFLIFQRWRNHQAIRAKYAWHTLSNPLDYRENIRAKQVGINIFENKLSS